MHYSLLNHFQSNLGNVLNTEDAVKHCFCTDVSQTAVINHIIFSECILYYPHDQANIILSALVCLYMSDSLSVEMHQ